MKKASTNWLKVGICRKNSIFHHFVEVCRSLYNTFLLVNLLIINIVESVEVVEAILLPNQMPSLITIGHKKRMLPLHSVYTLDNDMLYRLEIELTLR